MITRKEERVVTVDGIPDRSPTRVSTYSAIDQFVYLIFGIVTLMLLVRFIFRALGANPISPIVEATYAFTDVLMRPFRFIFPTNSIEGSVFEWSVVVAIIFYALIAWVVMRVIRILYTSEV